MEHELHGHLYVMRNNAFQNGLHKIGITSKTPEERAKQLSAVTGVPSPFVVEYSVELPDAKRVETAVHIRLSQYCVGKEFFNIDLETIIKCIQEVRNSVYANPPTRKFYSPEITEGTDSGKLVEKWEASYPNSTGARYLRTHHLRFCTQLTEDILSWDPDFEISFNRDSFSFSDGVRLFFDIKPQSRKIELAPLNLKPQDIEAQGIDYRDITGKKYRMGGLVRVDAYGMEDMDTAVKLARMSLESKNVIQGWSLLNKGKK